MKVKLNYIHVNNYGNLMMASIFIDKFMELNKDKEIEFYTDIENENEITRLKEALKNKAVINKKNYIDPKENNFFKKIITRLRLFSKEISDNKQYDAIVYLGGDAISEYYTKIGFMEDAIKIYLTSRKKKIYLVGQTIGPFTSYRKLAAKICFKNCELYTRDEKSYLYAKDQVGLKNIYKNRDLAFLDLAHEGSKELFINLKELYNIPEEYITIVPSGLYSCYTSDFDAYIEEYIKIICNIIGKFGKNLVVLAHVIHNKISNDKVVIDEIMRRLNERNIDVSKIVVITDLLQPVQARQILGNGKFTITGRMHAAVSSFAMKVPAISLSYSVKYEGVIGRGLDLNELIIETANEELWRNMKVHNLVNQKIEFVVDNYNELIKKININVDKTKELSMSQIQHVSNKINE